MVPTTYGTDQQAAAQQQVATYQNPNSPANSTQQTSQSDPLSTVNNLLSAMPSFSGGKQGVSLPKTPQQVQQQQQTKEQVAIIKAEGQARAQEIKAASQGSSELYVNL
jgi:hypothetical protein